MTIEEAIERIKEIYRKCNGFEDCRYGSDCEICLEAVDMAIAALEKQIPKKPAEHIIGVYCTKCKHFLDGTGYYCVFCGQAIDWSEEEWE